MATTIKYPLGLRTILLEGNQRQQSANFIMVEPRQGPPYVKRLSRDQPVFWTVTFRFERDERIVFWQWFTETLKGGQLRFLLDVQTEYGLVEHECWFLPDSLMNMTANTPVVFSYTAVIGSRELVKPDYIPSGIGDVPGIFKDRSILDTAINIHWPKAIGGADASI